MRRKSLWFLLVMLGLILTACAPKATPVAPTPVEATPKPPEATPTPVLILGPQPGAILTGPIEISGKATSGTITLTISEDGSSIASVSIALVELKCDGFSAGSMTQEMGGPFPVAEGNISASLPGGGELKGRFISPTEASGTINLVLEIPLAGTCDLGRWDWSAKAELETEAIPSLTPTAPSAGTAQAVVKSCNYSVPRWDQPQEAGIAVGEVANVGLVDLMVVRVAVELYDQQGKVLATGEGYTPVTVVLVGESVPYHARFDDPPGGVEGCRGTATYLPADELVRSTYLRDFEFSDLQLDGTEGEYRLIGTITNANPFAVHTIHMTLEIFDDSQKVEAVWAGFPEQDTLAPGESSPFMIFFSSNLVEPGHRILAEGFRAE